MSGKKIDIDSPGERFFGWLPKRKPSIILAIFVVIFIGINCFTFGRLPQILVFGWMPFPFFAYCFIICPIMAIPLAIYYYKYY